MSDFKVGKTYATGGGGYKIKPISIVNGNIAAEAYLTSATPAFIFLYNGEGVYLGFMHAGKFEPTTDETYNMIPEKVIRYRAVFKDASIDGGGYGTLEAHKNIVGVFVTEDGKDVGFFPIDAFKRAYPQSGYKG